MVAIKNADAFIARPSPEQPVVLVFGPDAGLVRERAERLIKASVDDLQDPFALVRLEGDALASDAGPFEASDVFAGAGGVDERLPAAIGDQAVAACLVGGGGHDVTRPFCVSYQARSSVSGDCHTTWAAGPTVSNGTTSAGSTSAVRNAAKRSAMGRSPLSKG